MCPLVVRFEALNKVDGGLVALPGREHEEVIRLLAGDRKSDRLGQFALLAEIITCADDKSAFGVIVAVRLLRPIEHAVAVPEKRRRNIYRSRFGFGCRGGRFG